MIMKIVWELWDQNSVKIKQSDSSFWMAFPRSVPVCLGLIIIYLLTQNQKLFKSSFQFQTVKLNLNVNSKLSCHQRKIKC